MCWVSLYIQVIYDTVVLKLVFQEYIDGSLMSYHVKNLSSHHRLLLDLFAFLEGPRHSES